MTRRLPLFHIQTPVVEASLTQPFTHVSFTKPFLRNRLTPAPENKVWFSPSPSGCRSKSVVLTGFVWMTLQVSGARFVLRPQCVHRQVSCTSDSARPSTDRPAAETILSRALIGSSNPREEPMHVWQLFQTHDCSMNFSISCGSKSCQLSTADQ